MPRKLPAQNEPQPAGDPYMVEQLPDKTYTATVQRHTRGIWTDSARRKLLLAIRRTSALGSASREETLSRLWRAEKMGWLTVPFSKLRRAVVRAQDMREPVTPEIDKRIDGKWPGLATFMRLLDEDRVVNRGNAHVDLRSLAPDGDHLIGFTLLTPGAILQRLRGGKVQEIGRNKFVELGTKIVVPGKDRVVIDRIQATKKSVQPIGWLDIVDKTDIVLEAEAGEVGATEATAGRFDFITGGGVPFRKRGRGRVGFSVVYGVRRSDFHEQFHLHEDPALADSVGGRWTFRLLSVGDDESLRWLARRVDDPAPFIFNNDFEAEAEQANKEKNDLIWNRNAVAALEKAGYFKDHGLEDELAEWKASDRGKPPQRGGVMRARPAGKLAKAPEIFTEGASNSSPPLDKQPIPVAQFKI